MGIRINTNVASINTRRHLSDSTNQFNKSMEKLSSGLRINQKAREAILPIANTAEYAAAEPLAEKHESLKGFWWVPELIPRRIKDPARNYAARWIWPLGRPRGVPDDAVVHDSVRLRRAGKPGYCPTNLPGAVTFVS